MHMPIHKQRTNFLSLKLHLTSSPHPNRSVENTGEGDLFPCSTHSVEVAEAY